MDSQADITGNLAEVRARIATACAAADRDAADVTLVAVSKTHPATTIQRAIDAGQKVFGENRVQEAEGKWPALKRAHPDLVLHLIGPLQSNKTGHAVALFDVIETVDRPKIARALAREMDKQGRRPDCLIQVNTGEEAQKAGIHPADADGFIDSCRNEFELPLAGLMCIPPVDEEPAMHFSLLRDIARRNDLPVLSMGMSADFATAVRFGATHVRVGTAIFGTRQPYPPATAPAA